jgi:hypothetical protein
MGISDMHVVRRRKLAGSIWHYGVVLAPGQVVEFSEDGLHTRSLLDFAAGEQVESVRRISPTEYPAVQMRLAWIRLNPRPYHLASWNCEVFANWLAGDTQPKSEQVGWVLALGTLLGLAWLFARA